MSFDVYLELGATRTFAAALQWPGWCRGAKDADLALQALVEYGPRYRKAVSSTGGAYKPAIEVSELKVVERLKGDSTTDFGAPGMIPRDDKTHLGAKEFKRLCALLCACWDAFESTAATAKSKNMRPGPRGGGRDLAKIVEHVSRADAGYLHMLGARWTGREANLTQARGEVRDAFMRALEARYRGEVPDHGPRGGLRWPAPYAVRRSAWHALDHAWEIEDRLG